VQASHAGRHCNKTNTKHWRHSHAVRLACRHTPRTRQARQRCARWGMQHIKHATTRSPLAGVYHYCAKTANHRCRTTSKPCAAAECARTTRCEAPHG
jgi:hypothetical protein